MHPAKRVCVLDDEPACRRRIARVLRALLPLYVVVELAGPDELDAALVHGVPAGIVFDEHVGRNRSGIRTIAERRYGLGRACKLLVTRRMLDRRLLVQANLADVHIVLKPVDAAVLREFARRVELEIRPRPSVDVLFAQLARRAGLSARQTEVATLSLRGLTHEETARELGIGHRTVQTHRREVFERCQVTGVEELRKLLVDELETYVHAPLDAPGWRRRT